MKVTCTCKHSFEAFPATARCLVICPECNAKIKLENAEKVAPIVQKKVSRRPKKKSVLSKIYSFLFE